MHFGKSNGGEGKDRHIEGIDEIPPFDDDVTTDSIRDGSRHQ